MSDKVECLIRRFEDAQRYEQEEPGDALFNWLLEEDEIPGLQIGRVRLRGPIHKTVAAHTEMHQVYLILNGCATIHLGAETQTVSGPTVVVIPKNTDHSVQVADGNSVEYVFVNQYR